MSQSPLIYRLPSAAWTLCFPGEAIATLSNHVQYRRLSRESVGQLYTRNLATDAIVVDKVTVLTPSKAARAIVSFDIGLVIKEREAMFDSGFHCIGLWHTHPESRPNPSSADRVLARDHALAAKPQLSGLVFAILGTHPLPSGLRVWIEDGQLLQEAEAISAVGITTPPPSE